MEDAVVYSYRIIMTPWWTKESETDENTKRELDTLGFANMLPKHGAMALLAGRACACCLRNAWFRSTCSETKTPHSVKTRTQTAA